MFSKVWAYIRKHDLPDAKVRRQINTDKLEKTSGKKSASMFEMNKPFERSPDRKEGLIEWTGAAQVLIEAEQFAVIAHGDQRYGNGPYSDHLAAVVQVLRDFGYAGPYEAAGWLHDVVEDTPVELATIVERFGPDVASMVDAVTGLGATRSERNARIYAGIAREPRAGVVKLADRIANVEAAAIGTDHGARYAREADAFASAVQPHVPAAMWSRLEAALLRHRSAGR